MNSSWMPRQLPGVHLTAWPKAIESPAVPVLIVTSSAGCHAVSTDRKHLSLLLADLRPHPAHVTHTTVGIEDPA